MKRIGIDMALLLLRVSFGGLMLQGHGWGKLMKLINENPVTFADPLGIGATASLALAVFAEVLCAMLLVLGLFTRLVSIPLIITMLVAVFVVHMGDPFPKMEKGLLYLIPYVCLLIAGPGRYSLDRQWLSK